MSAPFLYFIFPVLELKPRAVHMLGKCSTRELYLLVLSPFFHFSFQLAYRVTDFLMTFSCIFSFGYSPSPVVPSLLGLFSSQNSPCILHVFCYLLHNSSSKTPSDRSWGRSYVSCPLLTLTSTYAHIPIPT